MKRHVSQTKKQKTGSFFTKNAVDLLSGFEHLIIGKNIIDPFSGGGDLIKWAINNNALSSEEYDIKPKTPNTIKNNSLITPPDYIGKFLLTNPPYLSRNKSKKNYEKVFNKWKMDDLYKCHLATLYPTCDEGIIILPSNFLSESRSSAREMFFQNYTIEKAKYYMYQVFPEASTGVVVFNFYKNNDTIKKFAIEIHKSETDIIYTTVTLSPQYKYLYGDEFFSYITDKTPLKITKYDTSSKNKPNTKIVIGLLTNGKYYLGAHINDKEPLLVPEKTFTTYQVSIEGVKLSNQQQEQIVIMYNKKLQEYMEQYHGLFLANYMGANQKIKSRLYSNLLLSRVTKEVMRVTNPTLESFFT